ncbi:MAG: TetR/AcrR family transcriptional regulator [Alphaproteobacteria bacterium]|nr:MAG: TetR/AcrR family transcriptional regulator [Alphaproteobacteria bacterium]
MARGLARDHEQKRAAIRKGAARHFADRGFDRASMAGAARACGVSKALLYHYYDSKEALLFDILDAHLSTLVTLLEDRAEPPGEPRVRALFRDILIAYRDADAEHKLQLESLDALDSELRDRLIAHQRRLVAAMAEAIRPLVPAETPPDRLRALTMSAFALLNWFYLWHRPGRGISREEYAALAADLFINGAAAAASGIRT